MNTRFFSKILFASLCRALIYCLRLPRSIIFTINPATLRQCSAHAPGHGQMGVRKAPTCSGPRRFPVRSDGRGMMGRQGDQQGPAMAMRGMGAAAQWRMARRPGGPWRQVGAWARLVRGSWCQSGPHGSGWDRRSCCQWAEWARLARRASRQGLARRRQRQLQRFMQPRAIRNWAV
jgi:hypothetical protein